LAQAVLAQGFKLHIQSTELFLSQVRLVI